jgi:hypothetical protein
MWGLGCSPCLPVSHVPRPDFMQVESNDHFRMMLTFVYFTMGVHNHGPSSVHQHITHDCK